MTELDESAEDAARREILEETGLTIGALKLLGVYSGKNGLRVAENWDEWFTVMPVYGTKEYAGTLRMGDGESISLAWRDIGGLPKNIARTRRAPIGDYLRREWLYACVRRGITGPHRQRRMSSFAH